MLKFWLVDWAFIIIILLDKVDIIKHCKRFFHLNSFISIFFSFFMNTLYCITFFITILYYIIYFACFNKFIQLTSFKNNNLIWTIFSVHQFLVSIVLDPSVSRVHDCYLMLNLVSTNFIIKINWCRLNFQKFSSTLKSNLFSKHF